MLEDEHHAQRIQFAVSPELLRPAFALVRVTRGIDEQHNLVRPDRTRLVVLCLFPAGDRQRQ